MPCGTKLPLQLSSKKTSGKGLIGFLPYCFLSLLSHIGLGERSVSCRAKKRVCLEAVPAKAKAQSPLCLRAWIEGILVLLMQLCGGLCG